MKMQHATACRHGPDAVAWSLGGLDARAARRFERHRARCPSCAAETKVAALLAARLRAAPMAETSPGLAERIMRALPREQRAPRPMPVWGPAGALALAAAIVVAAGFLAHQLQRPNRGAAPRMAAAPAAAAAAADWLVAQQEADGSWRPSRGGGHDAYRPAVTALAMLALRQHAPTRHAAALRRAARALCAMQGADGGIGADDSARLYNHAFATHALLALARRQPGEQPFAATLERALAFTRQAQNAEGGWDYDRSGPGNTALSVWHISLLAEARAQGWGDEGGHLRRGLAWLRGQSDGGGSFGYRQPGVPQPGSDGLTLTAMAAATLQAAARDYPSLQPAAVAAIATLRRQGAALPAAAADYYRDYFVTQAFSVAADNAAAGRIAGAVAARHSPAGAGTAPWQGNDVWGKSGGDLYATAMALLIIAG
jgi:hypothetical protein